MADDEDDEIPIVKSAQHMSSDQLSKLEFSTSEYLFNRNSAYQIRPSLVDKFKPHIVKEVIHTTMHEELDGKVYDMEKSEMWIKDIVGNVRESVKDLGFKRYKLIVQAILGENKGSGVKIGARCLWDADTDNYASDYFLNDTIFCCVIVFGIYCY